MLAVRSLTRNKQEKFAGMREEILTPKQQRERVANLKITEKIKRGLQEQVKQAVTRLQSAQFAQKKYYRFSSESNSCQEAIAVIFNAIKYQAKYVLTADISNFQINQQVILEIKKSGRLENQKKGAQLLIINIIFSELENRINQYVESLAGNREANTPLIVRYDNSIVILHEKLEIIQKSQQILQEWQSEIRLELNQIKITHTLYSFENQKPGFDFLGFNIRQFTVGKHQSQILNGERLGFKTIIKPSKENVSQHYRSIAEVIDKHKAASQEILIKRLNPIIREWANYYATAWSKETYSKLDWLVENKLRRWAQRRHPNKGKKWVAEKYWHTVEGKNRVFAAKVENKFISLIKHTDYNKQKSTNNIGPLTEEPDEMKISRPVLKTSSSRKRNA